MNRKTYWIGCIFLFASVSVLSAAPGVEIPYYSCVRQEHVLLDFPAESQGLDSFYYKFNQLMKTGKGQIRILHIGGSHIQAGIFPHRLRVNFNTLLSKGSSPRGLLFPCAVAKTNNPPDFCVDYSGNWHYARNVTTMSKLPLGLTGMMVYSSDPEAGIRIGLCEDSAFSGRFNRVVLLGQEKNDSLRPYFLSGQRYDLLYDDETASWSAELNELRDSLVIGWQNLFPDSAPGFRLGGVLLDNDCPGIRYDAVGVNGASVSSFLRCKNFIPELKLINPDLIIFGLGINDAAAFDFSKTTFINTYDSLLTQIQHSLPACAYIFVSNNDSYQQKGKRLLPNENGLIAREVFNELATRYRAGFWDLFSLMGGLGSASEWEAAGLMKADRLHFTVEGYELLGDLLFNAIIESYYCRQACETEEIYRTKWIK